MSFVLPAIIIIIILFPGAVLLRTYYSHFKVKKASIFVPFTEYLVRGVFFSFFIHAGALSIIYNCYGKVPDLNLLYSIIIAKPNVPLSGDLTIAFLYFSLYSIIIILLSWLISKSFKRLVESYNAHLNYNALRNCNYWFEIFSAKYLERRSVKGSEENTDLLFLDVLVKDGIIYSGYLQDFNYSPSKDQLENLVLRHTFKRKLLESKQEGSLEVENETELIRISRYKKYQIPGDIFIVPADQIENINIHYLKVRKKKNDVQV